MCGLFVQLPARSPPALDQASLAKNFDVIHADALAPIAALEIDLVDIPCAHAAAAFPEGRRGVLPLLVPREAVEVDGEGCPTMRSK